MATRSCRLTGLSAELQNQIFEPLLLPHNRKELWSLSETCSFYRSLLAPHIFKIIHLVNTSKSGFSVDAVAYGRHRDCVQTLHYQGMAPGDSGSSVLPFLNRLLVREHEQFSNTQTVFPDIVGSVLSNLQRFSNLRTVIFEFPFDWDEWENGWELFEDPESPDDVRAAENEEGWRALMLKSYDALSSKPTLAIEEFEIKGLPPKEVSTFGSDEFHHFLGSLKRFRLSLRDWQSSAGWEMNTKEGFADFAEKLDQFFFDHLRCATNFVLKADETAPLGMDPGRYHVHLALEPQQMPQLRRLELRYIFVCPELVEFVVAHLETLEELVLIDCLCTLQLLDEDTEGMHWDALFDAISEGQPRKLKRLDVVSTEEIAKELSEWDDVDTDKFEEMRKVLEEDAKRRVFAYTDVDDKYGMLMEDYEEEVESFWRGDDQRAYDRLMDIVELNRAREGTTP